MTPTDANNLSDSVGFIGLGLMGKPMVENLAKKLPSGTCINVHDVLAAAVDELCSSYPERVFRCGSAKEVTEQSVSQPGKRTIRDLTS
jgi:3-hydroxyisobutyrate dehydrogenase